MKSIEEIKAAFDDGTLYTSWDPSLCDSGVNVTKSPKGGLCIEITAMYEAPQFKVESLLGLMALFQRLTGCENMDIEHAITTPGCETCDYGSTYGKVYRVW